MLAFAAAEKEPNRIVSWYPTHVDNGPGQLKLGGQARGAACMPEEQAADGRYGVHCSSLGN